MNTSQGTSIELVVPQRDEDWEFLRSALSGSGSAYSSTGPQLLSPGATEKFLQSVRDRLLVVVRAESCTRIGALYWTPGSYAGSFEIGYLVDDPRAWCDGVGARALSLLLTYLFHSLNAHRAGLVAGVFNLPVLEGAAANSLRVEGEFRDHFFLDGGYHPAVVFSILRDEYYAGADLTSANAISDAEKADARALLDDYVSSSRAPFTRPT
ncbi:GNAT family N-acetyltransferase [Lentzea sp. NPDC055074]